MKKTLIILAIMLILLAFPRKVLANLPDIQNIDWKNDYSIEFDEVPNATSYKYNFSVNTSAVPDSLFDVNSFNTKNNTISFFPKEALEYFKTDTAKVYRIWIIALDEKNIPLSNLTQSNCGKIIIFSKVNIPENIISSNNNTTQTSDIFTNASQDEKNESISNSIVQETNKEVLDEPSNLTNDAWKNPFNDVSENAWYYDSIRFSNQNNLLSGINDNEFGPKKPMTRGMLAYVLYKHSKDNSEINYSWLFSDVKESAYYYDAISWMRENNIAAGMGKNKFKPSDPVTREQLITILYNYSIYLGKDVKSIMIDFSAFDDADDVHAWAKVPLCWAFKNNLITGRTKTTLAPREATTRAEFATILTKFLEA